jgi:hypothetical protein
MKLWKIALCVMAMLAAASCGTHVKPKIKITHVLAVTEQGDTLRLPINMIKPNVYYNVISYPNRYYGGWYNNYYQPSYYNNRPIYAPSKGSNGSSSNNNNNNNNNNKIVPRDNPDKRPSGEVLLKSKK